MRKASELIQIAKEHPLYLCGKEQHWNWLCAVVTQLHTLMVFNRDEERLARDVITESLRQDESLYGTIYLRGFLTLKQVIPAGLPYQSPEYHRAAHAHWDELIATLQAQGL